MGSPGSGDVHANISESHLQAAVIARDIDKIEFNAPGERIPGHLQDPARWPLAKAWDPLSAGVHRARPDDAGDTVPPYVDRDIDALLQTRLTQAAERGGLVLLVGESTAGKTRAAHQAVHRCKKLSGYRVLAPDTGSQLAMAVEVVADTGVPCVLWLDDLERFLGPDGLQSGVLAELVRLHVPVLATMELRRYNTFLPAAVDPRTAGMGARVLKQTQPIRVRRKWSTAELKRALISDDLRLLEAVTHHGSYGIAEYLAAGPALLEEWCAAACVGGQPRGAALVAAAVDLARTGLTPPYPMPLLTALHHHYLGGPLSRPEPLDEALEWATRLRYGVTSLLLPTDDPGAWDVFNYLPDHTASPIRAQAWTTALDCAVDAADRFAIGLHAAELAPHIAEAAWGPLAQDEPVAAYHLAVLFSETGRADEAKPLYRRAADAGHADAANNLAFLLREEGRFEEAEKLYRQAVDAGFIEAGYNLATMLEQTGRTAEAEQILRESLDTGHIEAAYNLTFMLTKAGRAGEAEQVLRQAAADGHSDAVYELAALLLDQPDRADDAEQLLRQAADAGHTKAAYQLALVLHQTGRTDEAEQLYRQTWDADPYKVASIFAYPLTSLLAEPGGTDAPE